MGTGSAGKRRNSVETVGIDELGEYIRLTDDEREAAKRMEENFPFKISRYYAELIRGSDYDYPLRRVIVPSLEELIEYENQEEFDIHADESRYQPVEGIVHRYPGKLLFFPTLECFAHCRFCYRSGRRVASVLSKEKLDRAISYIRERSDIRDVVITGGDPLTLKLSRLEYILNEIRSIDHVEIIRIGTRVMAYAPEIVTPELARVTAKYKPVIMKLSFTHPDEITELCEEKLGILADAGIVLFQQGPLLKNINDSTEILKKMYEKLAKNRVIPYYAGYGNYTPGTKHFTVFREEAVKLVSSLENKTSGFCLPTLMTLDEKDGKTRKVN